MVKRLMLLFVLAVLSATANPIVETFINEFSADTVAGQWLELHALPGGSTWDLSNWRVLTSLSACDLHCTLDYYRPYIVIDSAGLARGENGSGTFRLNPLRDTITLVDDVGRFMDGMIYPCDRTSARHSLRPPPGGSASTWNVAFSWAQSLNCYIDSTPTPGEANDDYSTIAGTLLVDSMPEDAYVWVTPYGRLAGDCVFFGFATRDYTIQGLGPGWYHICAAIASRRGGLQGSYPDSVWVGYGQTVTGIDIDLRSGSIAEGSGSTSPPVPVMQTRGPELNVLCPSPSDVSLIAYDLTGRQRLQVHQGRLSAGRHRFDLTSRVAPGVYIVRALSRHYSASARLTVLR